MRKIAFFPRIKARILHVRTRVKEQSQPTRKTLYKSDKVKKMYRSQKNMRTKSPQPDGKYPYGASCNTTCPLEFVLPRPIWLLQVRPPTRSSRTFFLFLFLDVSRSSCLVFFVWQDVLCDISSMRRRQP